MGIELEDAPEILELNQLGGMMLASGKYEEAIKYFLKANKIDPNDIETYFNIGRAYGAMEKYDEAEEYFKKIILLDKGNPMVCFELGNIAFMKDNFEKGLENYNKAVSYGYDEPSLYFNLGMLYEEAENYPFAIRNYTKAINMDKFNAEYRIRQVVAFMKNENYDEALAALDEVNDYCPDIFEGYHYKFEIYCAQEKYSEAEKIIDKAIKLFPKDVSFIYDKIKLENLKGNYDLALKMIEKVKLMDGFEIEIRNLEFEMAKIYAQKEETDKVIEALKSAISYEGEEVDYEARYFLMNVYLSIEEYSNLLEEASFLSEKEEGEVEYIIAAMYYKALSLNKLGKYEEAKKQYDYCKRVFRNLSIADPTNLNIFMFRVLCYKDTKEYKKALELLDYVESLKEENGDIYAIRYSIYKELGDEEKAKENINKAKKYNKLFNELY